MKTTFICLANSRKHGGRCVAGLRPDGGGWLRLVSRDRAGTLSNRHYTLKDGAEAGLLDLIEVETSAARPEPHHPENLVVGRQRGWIVDWILGPPQLRLVGKIEVSEAPDQLAAALVGGPKILGNVGDRVSYEVFNKDAAVASLALVEPSGTSWIINESYRGNRIERRTQAQFRLSGQEYKLTITDPLWENRLSHLPYGTHPREAAGIVSDQRLFFTVSLSEPFHGVCFKLAAGVLVV